MTVVGGVSVPFLSSYCLRYFNDCRTCFSCAVRRHLVVDPRNARPNLPHGFDVTDPDIYADRVPVEEFAELRRSAPTCHQLAVRGADQPGEVDRQLGDRRRQRRLRRADRRLLNRRSPSRHLGRQLPIAGQGRRRQPRSRPGWLLSGRGCRHRSSPTRGAAIGGYSRPRSRRDILVQRQ